MADGGGGGAGYDISASRAESAAFAQNAAAGTVFNFGAGATVDGGWYGQTATPSSSAKASRDSQDRQGDMLTDGGGFGGMTGNSSNAKLYIAAGVAAVAVIAVAIYLAKRK